MSGRRLGKDTCVLTGILAAYLIFNMILLAGHELWRDEANVWLVARDLSVSELFSQIRFQGHPCLFYLLVMPFAKLGFPVKTMSVLCFLVMAAAAGLFVYCGPFSRVTKFLCLMSPIFTYYYSVVARNYCLIALLLILLAYLYEKRWKRPLLYGLLLGLLVQADTIALAPAGLISLMWLVEAVQLCVTGARSAAGQESESSAEVLTGARKTPTSNGDAVADEQDERQRTGHQPLLLACRGLLIPLASLLLWIYEFSGVSDSPEYRMQWPGITSFVRDLWNFCLHMLTRMTGLGTAFDLFLIVLFLAAGALLCAQKKRVFPIFVALGAFLFEAVFSVLVYQLHIWHYIATVFALIWFFWVERKEETNTGIDRSAEPCTDHSTDAGTDKIAGKVTYKKCLYFAGDLLLCLLAVTMFLRWSSDEESSNLSNALTGLYSDGVNVATYIEENVPSDALIISTNVAEAATVQAYLGKDYAFYYAGSREIETFADYTEEQNAGTSYEELMTWISEAFPGTTDFYILQCASNCISDMPQDDGALTLCYGTDTETARGEEYRLYLSRSGTSD